MCLDIVKRGFLVACRPIIGLDGCHLKGEYGHKLLVAVGRDPNDNYFPQNQGLIGLVFRLAFARYWGKT